MPRQHLRLYGDGTADLTSHPTDWKGRGGNLRQLLTSNGTILNTIWQLICPSLTICDSSDIFRRRTGLQIQVSIQNKYAVIETVMPHHQRLTPRR